MARWSTIPSRTGLRHFWNRSERRARPERRAAARRDAGDPDARGDHDVLRAGDAAGRAPQLGITSMVGTVTAGGWVARFGPIRVSQAGMLLCGSGLALAASGVLPAVVVGAVLIGLGYGPATPASSVILARAAPAGMLALTFRSSRPACRSAPPSRGPPSRHWSSDWAGRLPRWRLAWCARCLAWRNRSAPVSLRSAFAPVLLVLRQRRIMHLALTSLVYAGVQITLVAYLVAFVTESFGLSLVLAGLVMAASQLSSVASRILWGVVADRMLSRRATLGLLGVGMGITGLFALGAGPHGVFLAELTRLAPPGRIGDVAGGSSFFTFLGVVVTPPLFHLVLGFTSSYGATYALFGIPHSQSAPCFSSRLESRPMIAIDVVLAPGLWMPGAAMALLAARLSRAGYTAHVFAYRGRSPLASNTAHFARFVREALGGRPAHFVGHSLGGVLILEMLNAHSDVPVASAVLLGAPARGCLAGRRFGTGTVGRWMMGGCGELWQERQAVWSRNAPLGVVAGTVPVGLGRAFGRLPGTSDGVVRVEETEVQGMTDRVLVPVGHSLLIVSGVVGRLVDRFMRTGRFQ